MTSLVQTVKIDDSLETADRVMNEYNVRHLPIMDGGNLIGIISERDIALVRSAYGFNVDMPNVETVFRRNSLIISQDTSVAEACRQMVSTKTECVMICDNRRLIGIFSWIDGLDLLARLQDELE